MYELWLVVEKSQHCSHLRLFFHVTTFALLFMEVGRQLCLFVYLFRVVNRFTTDVSTVAVRFTHAHGVGVCFQGAEKPVQLGTMLVQQRTMSVSRTLCPVVPYPSLYPILCCAYPNPCCTLSHVVPYIVARQRSCRSTWRWTILDGLTIYNHSQREECHKAS